VLRLLEWVLSTYPSADPERVYLEGISMGGAGAMTLGLLHARHFCHVQAFYGQAIPRNHRPSRLAQLSGLWGAPAAGLDDGEGLAAWDRMDLTRVIAELPEARDHAGAVVLNGRIHFIGGRFDGSGRNSDLHHVYDAKADAWETRAPLPTPRSGHAAAVSRERIFVLGGETPGRVHGQNEGYDAKTDRWQSYAPVPTPRHGAGAVTIGETIYFAGGAPVAGTTFLTSIHEAFSPSQS
jgi:hypothetical protein